jgi:cyclophilin family peptidyl-prolyl cis-trans isomerase
MRQIRLFSFVSLIVILLSYPVLALANQTIVTVNTVVGSFDILMLEDDAPATVQNFLNYVSDGDFDGTFFHRSEPGFVVQGGGYRFDPTTGGASAIDSDPPVVNEFGISNTRGTVAMAKLGGNPNSATNEWFVNLGNNSVNLDNQNGGFTVFGRVIGNGMQVVDAIAALPRVNFGSPFDSTPTINYVNAVTADIFVNVTSIRATTLIDTDGDGIVDRDDLDDDNDTVPDSIDAFPLDVTESVDTDGDGIGNNEDSDDDGDGILDAADNSPLDPNIGGSFRLLSRQFIALPIVGQEVIDPSGQSNIVPDTATAAALNVTVVNPLGSGFLTVWPCGVDRPLSSNLNFISGSVVPNGVIAPIGSDGSVCLYTSAETDLVVDISGWFEGSAFTAATPKRISDTRDGTGIATGVPAQIGPDLALQLTVTNIPIVDAAGSSTGVPSMISAVALNVTVVSPDSAGFLTVYPCDILRPFTSNVNFKSGKIVANGVVAPISIEGKVCFFSSAQTDLVVDLTGWFDTATGSSFTAAAPKRLLDTRIAGAPLLPSTQLNIPIHGATVTIEALEQLIPTTASAVALNVTIVDPSGAGFATVWPCTSERPLASSLNFTAGQVVANNVIAPIGSDGDICFYSSTPSDLVVDISGYFSGDTGNEFIGSAPVRLIDTRTGLGPEPQ